MVGLQWHPGCSCTPLPASWAQMHGLKGFRLLGIPHHSESLPPPSTRPCLCSLNHLSGTLPPQYGPAWRDMELQPLTVHPQPTN